MERENVERKRIRDILVAAGLSLPRKEATVSRKPISDERRTELAELFSKGRPLSELILEEREEQL